MPVSRLSREGGNPEKVTQCVVCPNFLRSYIKNTYIACITNSSINAETDYFLRPPLGIFAGLLAAGLPIDCFLLPTFDLTLSFDLPDIGFEFDFPEGAEILLSLTLLFAPAFSEAGFQSFWTCFSVDFLTSFAFALLVLGLSLFWFNACLFFTPSFLLVNDLFGFLSPKSLRLDFFCSSMDVLLLLTLV